MDSALFASARCTLCELTFSKMSDPRAGGRAAFKSLRQIAGLLLHPPSGKVRNVVHTEWTAVEPSRRDYGSLPCQTQLHMEAACRGLVTKKLYDDPKQSGPRGSSGTVWLGEAGVQSRRRRSGPATIQGWGGKIASGIMDKVASHPLPMPKAHFTFPTTHVDLSPQVDDNSQSDAPRRIFKLTGDTEGKPVSTAVPDSKLHSRRRVLPAWYLGCISYSIVSCQCISNAAFAGHCLARRNH